MWNLLSNYRSIRVAIILLVSMILAVKTYGNSVRCPKGMTEIGRSCRVILPHPASTYVFSRLKCKQKFGEHARMMTSTSPQENQRVKDLMEEFGVTSLWLSIDQWRTPANDTVGFVNWIKSSQKTMSTYSSFTTSSCKDTARNCKGTDCDVSELNENEKNCPIITRNGNWETFHCEAEVYTGCELDIEYFNGVYLTADYLLSVATSGIGTVADDGSERSKDSFLYNCDDPLCIVSLVEDVSFSQYGNASRETSEKGETYLHMKGKSILAAKLNSTLHPCVMKPETCASGVSVSLWINVDPNQAVNSKVFLLRVGNRTAHSATRNDLIILPSLAIMLEEKESHSQLIQISVATNITCYYLLATYKSVGGKKYFSQWRNIAFTFDSVANGIHVYVDGLPPTNEATMLYNIPHRVIPGDNEYDILSLGEPLLGNVFFQGYLRNLAIWKRRFNSSEAKRHFQGKYENLQDECDAHFGGSYVNNACFITTGVYTDFQHFDDVCKITYRGASPAVLKANYIFPHLSLTNVWLGLRYMDSVHEWRWYNSQVFTDLNGQALNFAISRVAGVKNTDTQGYPKIFNPSDRDYLSAFCELREPRLTVSSTIDGTNTNIVYVHVGKLMTFSKAVEECERVGLRLLTFDSYSEINLIDTFLQFDKGTAVPYWIGIRTTGLTSVSVHRTIYGDKIKANKFPNPLLGDVNNFTLCTVSTGLNTWIEIICSSTTMFNGAIAEIQVVCKGPLSSYTEGLNLQKTYTSTSSAYVTSTTSERMSATTESAVETTTEKMTTRYFTAASSEKSDETSTSSEQGISSVTTLTSTPTVYDITSMQSYTTNSSKALSCQEIKEALTYCTSVFEVGRLLRKGVVAEDTASLALDMILNISASANKAFSLNEIGYILEILEFISQVNVSRSSTVEKYLDVLSVVIVQMILNDDLQVRQYAIEIMLNTEIIVEQGVKSNVTFEYSNGEIEIWLDSFQRNETEIKLCGDKCEVEIILEKNVTKDCQGTVAFVVYKNLHKKAPTISCDSAQNASINSKIVSVSLYKNTKERQINLERNITLILSPIVNNNDLVTKCAYWKQAIRRWSLDGCWHHVDENGRHVCTCNHMTNFALLLVANPDVQIDSVSDEILSILSTAGLTLSLIALGSLLACYILLKLLNTQKFMIHSNLALALFLGQILFITNASTPHHKIVCKAIGVLLHYFFMASFMWMFIEGLNLFLMTFSVNRAKTDMRLKYILIGWCLPLIIVGISFGAGFDGYGKVAGICWISHEDGAIYGFIAPSAVVLLANIGILLLVLRRFLQLKSNTKKTDIERIGKALKASFSLTPLLGVTWIFGFLGNMHVAFMYVFVILLAFQGVCLFFVHCALNGEIQIKFKRMFSSKIGSSHAVRTGSSSPTAPWPKLMKKLEPREGTVKF